MSESSQSINAFDGNDMPVESIPSDFGSRNSMVGIDELYTLRNFGVTMLDTFVYGVVRTLTYHGVYTNATNAEISDWAGCTPNSVSRSLSRMIKSGLVISVGQGPDRKLHARPVFDIYPKPSESYYAELRSLMYPEAK